jgi:hypothetical protein
LGRVRSLLGFISVFMIMPRLRSALGMLVVAIVATLSCHGREPVSLFPELQGWKKGEEASWGPDNLYVPIDGARTYSCAIVSSACVPSSTKMQTGIP